MKNVQVYSRIHTKERCYKCKVCNRAFEQSGKLYRHMRIHTGERPHRCSVCGKAFKQSGELIIHMRTHTGEKPYKCPDENCGKGFTSSKQLKVHSRSHTGEKPYRCDICKRDFGYNHVLKSHRVKHYKQSYCKCTICDKTFKSNKATEAHIKGHANDNEEVISGSLDIDRNTSLYRSPSVMQTKKGNESLLNMSLSLVTSTSLQSKTNLSLRPRIFKTQHELSSETNSDDDDPNYYKYSRFKDHSTVNSYNSYPTPFCGGVNAAQLAACSMAVSSSEKDKICNMTSTYRNPPSFIKISSPIRSPPITVTLQHQVKPQQLQNHLQYNVYEPLSLMRQQGFFAPVPKVEKFRSSIDDANKIIKLIEAALAGVESSLLTPSISSIESQDRSSTSENDSTLLSSRDNMSLRLQKHKLFMTKPQDHYQHQNTHNQQHQKDEKAAVMRMSSVIKFAKSS